MTFYTPQSSGGATSSTSQSLVFKKLSVNLKTAAANSVFTALNKFVVTRVDIVCTGYDTVTVKPSVSVGTNSTAFDNLQAITQLTGITAADTMQTFLDPGVVAGGGTLTVKVTTGATATTMTADIFITGFYAV